MSTQKTKCTPQDIQAWAREVLNACNNLYDSKMDCATVNALYRLGQGELFEFVASRYIMDNREALSIVTEYAQVEGVSFGYSTFLKYNNIEGLYQMLRKFRDTEVLAAHTSKRTTIFLKAYGIENWMRWHKNPTEQIEQHNKWKKQNAIHQICNDVIETCIDKDAMPSTAEIIEMIETVLPYLDEELTPDAIERKNKIIAMNQSELETEYFKYGLHFGIYHIVQGGLDA